MSAKTVPRTCCPSSVVSPLTSMARWTVSIPRPRRFSPTASKVVGPVIRPVKPDSAWFGLAPILMEPLTKPSADFGSVTTIGPPAFGARTSPKYIMTRSVSV